MQDIRSCRTAVSLALTAVMLSGCLSGGGGSSSRSGAGPEQQTRLHDERTFVPAEKISFEARPGTSAYYGIYEGIQGDAIYAVEIPDDWDERGLIMFARGFAGDGGELNTVLPPAAWRDAVLAAGYAWASSSYSATFYDVRAGIEDTNKLAAHFTDYLLADYGVQFNSPEQILISGTSMGGHVAAAAVDRENRERTLTPVDYAGAAPFCQAEQNEFQWLGDYPRLMQEMAGYGHEDFSSFQELLGTTDEETGRIILDSGPMVRALFNVLPNGMPNWGSPANLEGERLKAMAMHLTGGPRPLFDQGFASFFNNIVVATGGSDGTVDGILAYNVYDNMDRIYRWTDDPEPTDEELAFNERIERVAAHEHANDVREDGVRWIPHVHGDFDVPVLTMHTLGDFYVPFLHQQLYRQGAEAHGKQNLLVQRAIRAPGHCDFSDDEYTQAINDWLAWVNEGVKPAGDEVLDAATVADANYGCSFTAPERSGMPSCAP